jgi:hypothetical protein
VPAGIAGVAASSGTSGRSRRATLLTRTEDEYQAPKMDPSLDPGARMAQAVHFAAP